MDDARSLLRACCGSQRWVDEMIARRPFNSDEDLLAAARHVWFGLTPDDWREAFGQHPRIGDRGALARRFPDSHILSAREQAGVSGASHDVLSSLADRNREYHQKFGYIFIVCATGRSADEMLAILETRLGNLPEAEIHIAASEQAKITELRLGSIALHD